MSTNLNAPLQTGGQANPEVTHNDGIGAMDAAITELLTVDCTNSVSLTDVQYRSAFKFKLTPVGVSKTLTLPAIKRWTYIQNSGANAINIVRGATSILLPVGSQLFFYTDGTTDGLEQISTIGSAFLPHDLHIFLPGLPTAGAVMLRFNATREFTLPISLTGSIFNARVAATGTATFTLKKNGSSIGTIVWSAAGTVGAPTFASAVTFAVNDIFTIEAPSPQDATLADVSLDFLGTR